MVNDEQKTKPSFEVNTASVTLSYFIDCNLFVLLYRSVCFHFSYLTFSFNVFGLKLNVALKDFSQEFSYIDENRSVNV